MYIKLNYTSNKKMIDCIRTIDDIINTTSTTSISALSTRMGSSYGTTIATGFSTSTSDLIRTVGLSLTKSHLYMGSTDVFRWTLEFGVYDVNTTKYYVQLYGASATAMYGAVSSAITGGTITSSAALIGYPSGTSSGPYGTLLTPAGTVYGGSSTYVMASTSAPANISTIRTFWVYINDRCIVMAWTLVTSYNNGWGTTYSDSTQQCGPYIFGQYTRFDYYNTDANGIIPMLIPNLSRYQGKGFGDGYDYSNNQNPFVVQTNAASAAFSAFNTINAYPAITSSWPTVAAQPVYHHIGYTATPWYVAQDATSQGANTVATVTYGKAVSTTAAERWPTATLQGTAFQLLPITWSYSTYGNAGGNLSAQSGIYLFNGDFQPGDEFGLNARTWSVWPIWTGYSARIGLAIPKE